MRVESKERSRKRGKTFGCGDEAREGAERSGGERGGKQGAGGG